MPLERRNRRNAEILRSVLPPQLHMATLTAAAIVTPDQTAVVTPNLATHRIPHRAVAPRVGRGLVPQPSAHVAVRPAGLQVLHERLQEGHARDDDVEVHG